MKSFDTRLIGKIVNIHDLGISLEVHVTDVMEGRIFELLFVVAYEGKKKWQFVKLNQSVAMATNPVPEFSLGRQIKIADSEIEIFWVDLVFSGESMLVEFSLTNGELTIDCRKL